MSNCPQINNTTIIGTSDVFYDGPQLPCSNIETCDTLNVAFEKLDGVVCVIIEDVESLTNEVNNIEKNLVGINNTLVIINNQLNICCPTTTTTSSSSTSTTTTSTSSTTTTTTTEPPLDLICFCLFLESVGCGVQYSFLLSGNGPLFNGRPTYNFLPFLGYPAQVYYNGSNWVFYSSDLDLTQPLINSNYYPVGDYLDWGTVTVTGLMNSSSLGPCPEITTTTTSSSSSTSTTTSTSSTTTTSTSTSTSTSTTTSTTTATPTTTTTTTPSENNLIANNLYSSVYIDSVFTTSCSIALPTDIGPGLILYGDIPTCNDDINVVISGASPSGHCMSLIINGVIEDEQSFTTDGTYVLTNPGISSTDIVVILVRDGNCLSTRQGLVSATSSATDACPIPMTITCWVTGNTDIVNGLIVYTDMSMLPAYKFVGDGDLYHIQLDAYPNSYSMQINNIGVIDASLGFICGP